MLIMVEILAILYSFFKLHLGFRFLLSVMFFN